MLENENLSEWHIIHGRNNGIDLSYKELNYLIRKSIRNNKYKIKLVDIFGQRFIGAGLENSNNKLIELEINGVPGNDLGIFIDGPKIFVNGNAEDQVGNTMNSGTIIIDGDCRDIAGLSMRGGKIFVKGNCGYRIGIHMKEYRDQIPIIIIGGSAKEFFGEYMAGGILIALGLKIEGSKISTLERVVSPNLASGIHGGKIFLRGEIPEHYLGVGSIKTPFSEADYKCLQPIVTEFCNYFNISEDYIWDSSFYKITPSSHRPYGDYYTAKPI
ncbi:MAG: hypothetical protein ACTSPY_09165 [Candidatus Helarchaeota archaeon]